MAHNAPKSKGIGYNTPHRYSFHATMKTRLQKAKNVRSQRWSPQKSGSK